MNPTRLFLAACLHLLSLGFLSAQITMVGVSQNSATGNLDVIRWDAVTGVVFQTVPTTENSLYMASSALDVSTGKYYFRGLNGLQEIGFFPPQVRANSLQFDLGNTEVDMRTGKLYGLNYTPVTNPNGQIISGQLSVTEYVIADSTETLVYNLPQVLGYYADVSAFDSNHGTYYFLGIDSLLGSCLYKVNLSGTTIFHTVIPVANNSRMFFTLEYDNDTNTLLGLGVTPDSNGIASNLQVLEMDTLTAQVTLVRELLKIYSFQSASTTYDQANHTMAFIAFDSVMTFLAYDRVNDSLYSLILPGLNTQEIEADNTQYALARYRSTTRNDKLTSMSPLTVWPQPATDWIWVEGSADIRTLELYDIQGRRVYQGNTSNQQVSLAGIPDGMYMVRALDRNGMLVGNARIMKKGGK